MISEKTRLSENADHILGDWFDMQQQLWNFYSGTAKSEHGLPWQHLIEDSLSVCEEIVDNTIMIRTEWAHQCFELINDNDKTTPVGQWSDTLDKLIDSWTETERQCCNIWFAYLLQRRSVNTAEKTTSVEHSCWRTWQETMQKTLNMQMVIADQLLTNNGKNYPG